MKPLASICCLALATCGLAACSPPPAPSHGAAAPASAPAANASAPAATPGASGLPADHAETPRYKIAIDLPTLPAGEQALAAALRTAAADAKRGFMQALPDPAQVPRLAGRQFWLPLQFKVTGTTPAFTSVRETGSTDSGGAHPIPVEATFVLDRKAGKLVGLDDLFTDPAAARKQLADFARADLRRQLLANAPGPGDGSATAIREWHTNMQQMLADGSTPTAANYALFVVRAGATPDAASPGITLVFPPYQVAPYAVGTLTVDVPANVFAKFLRPGYQGDFAPN